MRIHVSLPGTQRAPNNTGIQAGGDELVFKMRLSEVVFP